MSFQVGIPTVLSSKSPWILDPWAWAMPPYQVVKSGKYFWAMVLSRLFHAAACSVQRHASGSHRSARRPPYC